jgi:hypothetical protein
MGAELRDIEIDIQNFNKMISLFERVSKKPRTEVLKKETGSVLRLCIQQTKVASKAKLKRLTPTIAQKQMGFNKRYKDPPTVIRWMDGSIKKEAQGNAYINFKGSPKKRWINLYENYKQNNKKTTYKAKNGKTYTQDGPWKRWKKQKASVWLADAQEENFDVNRLIKKEIDPTKAQGLTVQGWLHIAEAIGVNVQNVPPLTAKIDRKVMLAKKATGISGRRYRNGTGHAMATGTGKDYIEIINKYPSVNKPIYQGKKTGRQVLQIALYRRVSALTSAIQHDIFKDMEVAGKQFATFGN